jgi:F-type H+-transporting ATPase subunit a
VNLTLAMTWLVMALLVLLGWLAGRGLSATGAPTRRQLMVELVVEALRGQIRELSGGAARPYLPFVGTLFLFIATSNLLAIVPGYVPPTSSLSTTAALAGLVFLAVPAYGVMRRGPLGYLRGYLQPSPLMLPFNLIGELSRTLALAVRLFGNVMSGVKIAALALALAPLLVPIPMQLFGLLTGLIQAYIFSVLAMVYIASAAEVGDEPAPLEAEERSRS